MQNQHQLIYPILDHIPVVSTVQAIPEVLAGMELLAMNPRLQQHILHIHLAARPLAPPVVVVVRHMNHLEPNTIQEQLNWMVLATKQLAGITFLHIIRLPRVQFIRKFPEIQQH